MTVATRTELVITAKQIVGGEQVCAYCDDPAVLTIATRADPKDEPVCIGHGTGFLRTTIALLGRILAPAAREA